MFSSSGYFKGVVCPFFANGLCERPCCHFRHATPDKMLQKPTDERVGTVAPPASKGSMLGMMGSAILQVQRNELSATKPAPTYHPTPIHRNLPATAPHIQSPRVVCGLPASAPKYLPPTNTPQYNPTPIKLLQAQTKCNNSKDEFVSTERTRITLGDAVVSADKSGIINQKRLSTEDCNTLEAKKHRQNSKPHVVADIKKMESPVGVEMLGKQDVLSVIKEAPMELELQTVATPPTPKNQQSNAQQVKLEISDQKKDTCKDLNIFDILKPTTDSVRAVINKEKDSKPNDCQDAQINESPSSMKLEFDVKTEVVDEEIDENQSCEIGLSTEICDGESEKKATKSSPCQSSPMHPLSSNCRAISPRNRKDSSNSSNKDSHLKTSNSSKNSSIKSSKDRKDNSCSSHKDSHSKSSRSSKELSSRSSPPRCHKSHHLSESSRRKSSSGNHNSYNSSKSASKTSSGKHHSHNSHSISSSCQRHSSKNHKSYSSGSDSAGSCRHSHASSRHRKSSRRSSSKRHSSSGHSSSRCNSTSKHHSTSRHRARSRYPSRSCSHCSSRSSSNSPSSHSSCKHHHHHHLHRRRSSRCSSPWSSGSSGHDIDSTFSDHERVEEDVVQSDHSNYSDPVNKTNSKPLFTQKQQASFLQGSSRIELFGSDSDIEAVSSTISGHELQPDKVKDKLWEDGSGDDSVITLSLCDDNSDGANDAMDQVNFLSEATDTEERNVTEKPIQFDVDKNEGSGSDDPDDDLPILVAAKKRLAHQPSTKSLIKPGRKVEVKMTPAQIMLQRFAKLQEGNKQQASEDSSLVVSPDSSSALQTSCLSLSKNNRKAHVPHVKVIRRPMVAAEASSKVPTNIRQRQLNRFCDEFLGIYAEEQDAYDQAVEEEREIYHKSSSKNIYLNKASVAIKRIRDQNAPHSVPPLNPMLVNPKALSHEAMLGGSKAASTSFTVKRSGVHKEIENLTADMFLDGLIPHKLTFDQLVENCFPYLDPTDSQLKMKKSDRALKAISSNPNERLCSRCGKRFLVKENGKYAQREQCIYHWGKSWKRRVCGSVENRFTCCQQDASVKGCQIAENHVHDYNRYTDMSGYISTTSTCTRYPLPCHIFSLDCEMVYTTVGLELARVTVINMQLDTVIELLVRPDNPVLDYNTRFSGITASDMHGVDTRIEDVQEILLGLFTDKTILMGHSLESDFIALKLIHSSIVDTSVVFPHRLGPPYKRALKTLMAEFLQKIIQEDEGGHDSKEDAAACMKLMLWKVKEELKKSHRIH